MKLSFFVHGIPQPQGSMRAIPLKNGKIAVTSANKNLRPWRQDLALEAVIAANKADCPCKGPVEVSCVFQFPRPKSLPKRVTDKVTAPDLDKLIRAVLDSLKHTVVVDDAQVISIKATKVFDSHPGAYITVETVEKKSCVS